MQETVNRIVEILDKFICSTFGITAVIFVIMTYLWIKNENTYRQHVRIENAIGDYQMQCAVNKIPFQVDYIDMELYDATLFRVWDWGYANILPKGKFELIKPFIKEKQK